MGVMRQLRKSLKQNQRYEIVKRKAEASSLGDGVRFVRPRHGKKMSDVLMEFAEPFLDPLTPMREQQDVIAIAAICWNLSFLPPEERKDCLRESLAESAKDPSGKAIDELESDVQELIERKASLFANDKRFIVSWHFDPDDGDGFLSVAHSVVE